VKVDGMLAGPLGAAGEQAHRLEQSGYSGGWTIEGSNDPFLPHVIAAEHSSTLELGTAIAVAFARNPMTLAHTAWDLQGLSGGRFILGLGSQIKPHITKRFSMPWSQPAARMRELILAIRAIWETWLTGTRLQFRGEFYTHTLMTPFFSPSRADVEAVGLPRIFLAGVGPAMTEVAGEVADGFICHPFTTERYLREVTLPALRRGREKVGRDLVGFEISGPSFVVTGTDDAEIAAAHEATRRQIAFYGSTPVYRAVLDLHGWGDLQGELNRLSKAGEWADMGALIDDNLLTTFAIVADPEDVAPRLGQRFGDAVTRISLPTPFGDRDRWATLVTAIQAL
jgi:probable F420-dependent oxidoreductase